MDLKSGFLFTLVLTAFLMAACGQNAEVDEQSAPPPKPVAPTPQTPATLAEILDKKNTQTVSPLGNFDFRNMTYPLPRGWQDADGRELTLENGLRRMTKEKIGISYQTVKFGDVTGDGNDEAFVILRVDTGGAAIPQIVYVVEWQEDKPEIIWYFRTGDRADGGLKRVYADSGDLMVELFGQDRYLFNQMETLKIIGDEVQLCCPTSFTKTRYKRDSKGFKLTDKRLTYSLTDSTAKPIANMGDKLLEEKRGKNK